MNLLEFKANLKQIHNMKPRALQYYLLDLTKQYKKSMTEDAVYVTTLLIYGEKRLEELSKLILLSDCYNYIDYMLNSIEVYVLASTMDNLVINILEQYKTTLYIHLSSIQDIIDCNKILKLFTKIELHVSTNIALFNFVSTNLVEKLIYTIAEDVLSSNAPLLKILTKSDQLQLGQTQKDDYKLIASTLLKILKE